MRNERYTRREIFTIGLGERGPPTSERPSDRPSRPGPLVMVVARPIPHLCVGPTSFCTACVEHCPIDGAITLRDARPVIDASLCDGCGRCRDACVAPEPALALVPALLGGPS